MHHQQSLHHQLNGISPHHPSEQPLLASDPNCGSGITSAVRSLNSLSDFSDCHANGTGNAGGSGGFDFSASDSLLTENAIKIKDGGNSSNNSSSTQQQQQQQQQQPLMDFKSAFTDGKNPASELGFLHLDLENGGTGSNAASSAGNSGPQHPTHPVDLNPMDFIENETGVVGNGTNHVHGSSGHGHFDMDPFDLMSEFPEMQNYQMLGSENNNRNKHNNNNSNSGGNSSSSNNNNHLESNSGGVRNSVGSESALAQISDFSPEWSWSDVSLTRHALFKGRIFFCREQQLKNQSRLISIHIRNAMDT